MSTIVPSIGGVGGSGTRVVAGMLKELGYFIGGDLNSANDNLWYVLLFNRRCALLDSEFTDRLIDLFFQQMQSPRELEPIEREEIFAIAADNRIQHSKADLNAWAESFVNHKTAAEKWAWKVPPTHVLVDRMLAKFPSLRYVHVVRDGRDMALSKNQNQLKTWGPVFLSRDVQATPRDSLAYWCAVHRRLDELAAKWPGRIHYLNYDRMLSDPETVLRAMFSFLECAVSEQMLSRFCDRIQPPSSIGRGQEILEDAFAPEDLLFLKEFEMSLNQTGTDSQTSYRKSGDKAQRLVAERVKSTSLPPGGDHYRAYVGPPAQYDFMGATQFRLLTALGLTEEHKLLDIGCGSLRAGRFLIQYLLPGGYVGIEPNSWLWEQAMEVEIGKDIFEIKKPRLLADPDFTLEDVGGLMDFVVAQSIYSHCGIDAFARSVGCTSRILQDNGQFLFTAIRPGSGQASSMPPGNISPDWVYPGCVTYTDEEVLEVCAAAGLKAQALPWFHPRQTWFRATKNGSVLDDSMLAQMGSGKPLFDPRV